MCSFTVAPMAQRWYFHHQRTSQLSGATGAAETVGFCEASTSVAGSPCVAGLAACGGICRNLQTDPMHCGACNNACGAGGRCVAGACMTAPRRYTRTTPPLTTAFVDACVLPGAMTLLRSVDDNTAPLTMPFDFRYWGDVVPMGARLTVSSNGLLALGVATLLPISGNIPSTSAPNGVIAPHWLDLETGPDGVCVATVGTAPDRRFVVHWSNLRNYSLSGTSTDRLNFEAVLNERDASIDFLYTAMTGALTATAGLENPAGTDAIGACPAGAGATRCIMAANTRVRFAPAP
jgi:hypothetical protein